ncbi:MAG TPA: hypothetical protein VME69_06600 [Methylocella sp.]|nr:hypothetical protein [Methylocella sp.]
MRITALLAFLFSASAAWAGAVLPQRTYSLTPSMFGAYGDGVHDDTTALQATLTAGAAQNLKVDLQGYPYLTGALSLTGSAPLMIDGQGSWLKAKSGTGTVLSIQNNPNYFSVQNITIQAQGNAQNCLNTSNSTYAGAQVNQFINIKCFGPWGIGWIAAGNNDTFFDNITINAANGLTPNASTSTSSNVLNFASVPSWVSTAIANETVYVTDSTNYLAIAPGTHITAVSSTTITLSANVTATVNSGDLIYIGSGIALQCNSCGGGHMRMISPEIFNGTISGGWQNVTIVDGVDTGYEFTLADENSLDAEGGYHYPSISTGNIFQIDSGIDVTSISIVGGRWENYYTNGSIIGGPGKLGGYENIVGSFTFVGSHIFTSDSATGVTLINSSVGCASANPIQCTVRLIDGWIDTTEVSIASTSKVAVLSENAVGTMLPSSTVANLPTCGTNFQYMLRAVTDATSPTYGGTLTGGGSTPALAMCVGSSWLAH